MSLATASWALAWVGNECRWYVSFFEVAKKDSAAALFQQLPARPVLVRIRLARQNQAKSVEVYGPPRFE